jgi:hypothetical protein
MSTSASFTAVSSASNTARWIADSGNSYRAPKAVIRVATWGDVSSSAKLPTSKQVHTQKKNIPTKLNDEKSSEN